MAQGAATSMEDGTFLSVCLSHVARGVLSLPSALSLYEKARKPLTRQKAMLSFLNGQVWMLPLGVEREKRDRSMEPEVKGQGVGISSANLYGEPGVVREVFGYDAELHAENEIRKFMERRGDEEADRAEEEETWRQMREKFMGFEKILSLEHVRRDEFWKTTL